MFSRARALYPDITGVIISASAPAASDSDKLWIKTSSGAPVGQFIRYNAQWVWPHLSPASGSERRLWVGTLVALESYDGGSAGTVGAASGPMWEEDTAFRDRIPIGVGPTLAPAVVTNYGDSNAQYTLVENDIPRHSFFTARQAGNNTGAPYLGAANSMAYQGGGMANENYNLLDAIAAGKTANVGPTNEYGGSPQTPLNFLNPVRALYVIQRTARIYYLG